MVQQLGDVENRFFGTCGVKEKGHFFKMIVGVAEVGRLSGVRNAPCLSGGVAVRTFTAKRMVPIAHHLRHGGGYTTGKHMIVRTVRVYWTMAVVVFVLVPCGFQ